MAASGSVSTVTPRTRPARNGLALSGFAEHQRSRVIAGMIECVERDGYARLTVEKVLVRSRVSRKSFYDLFSDREDCFLAAFEHIIARARVPAGEAYARESGWREGIRATLECLLGFMDDEPGLARLCVIETLAAGERTLKRRTELFAELAHAVDRGRATGEDHHDPPPVTAETVVGGVTAVIQARLLEGAGSPLSDLAGPLMSMVVLPYLGPQAAREELTAMVRRRPKINGVAPAVSAENPLDGLDMRLTYRTVRVLSAIAENPGASNRLVAQESGIVDQGQISKLLTRLTRLRLVRNRGSGHADGSMNAWHLTARGAKLERTARPR